MENRSTFADVFFSIVKLLQDVAHENWMTCCFYERKSSVEMEVSETEPYQQCHWDKKPNKCWVSEIQELQTLRQLAIARRKELKERLDIAGENLARMQATLHLLD